MSLYKTIRLVHEGVVYSFDVDLAQRAVLEAAVHNETSDAFEPVKYSELSDRIKIELDKAIIRLHCLKRKLGYVYVEDEAALDFIKFS